MFDHKKKNPGDAGRRTGFLLRTITLATATTAVRQDGRRRVRGGWGWMGWKGGKVNPT